MKKIIVCGSRDLTDQPFVEEKLTKLTAKLASFELITGGCLTGADRFAELWAEKQRLPAKKVIRKHFYADWKGPHGKAAGPMRNFEMALYVGKKGVCVAFRKAKGPSPGTDDMIAKAEKQGMQVIVYKI